MCHLFLTKLVRDRTASTARISRFGPTVPERKWPAPPTSVRLRIPPLPVPSPSPRFHRPRRSRRRLIRSSPPVDVTSRRHTPPAAPIASTSPLLKPPGRRTQWIFQPHLPPLLMAPPPAPPADSTPDLRPVASMPVPITVPSPRDHTHHHHHLVDRRYTPRGRAWKPERRGDGRCCSGQADVRRGRVCLRRRASRVRLPPRSPGEYRRSVRRWSIWCLTR